MLRVLASHQCGLGLIPGPGVMYGLSLSFFVFYPEGRNPMVKMQVKGRTINRATNQRIFFYILRHQVTNHWPKNLNKIDLASITFQFLDPDLSFKSIVF